MSAVDTRRARANIANGISCGIVLICGICLGIVGKVADRKVGRTNGLNTAAWEVGIFYCFPASIGLIASWISNKGMYICKASSMEGAKQQLSF